jgi:hypothetical protein
VACEKIPTGRVFHLPVRIGRATMDTHTRGQGQPLGLGEAPLHGRVRLGGCRVAYSSPRDFCSTNLFLEE